MKPATLLGLGIGDALGMPFESLHPDHYSLKSWDGKTYLGSKHHNLNPGQWTDDTEMSMELAKSLIERQKYDPALTSRNYLGWYKGAPRGIGGTIREAMENLKKGEKTGRPSWVDSGVLRSGYCGNGTAMRIAPIGIAYRSNPERLVVNAELDAIITHRHTAHEAELGSAAMALGVGIILNEGSPREAIKLILDILGKNRWSEYSSKVLMKLELAEKFLVWNMDTTQALSILGNGGDVADTASSAFFCASRYSDNFPLALEVSVRAGGDTDTRTSMVGALLGSSMDVSQIPENYLFGLEKPYDLIDLGDRLMELNPKE